jgi:acyl-CoA reductase-like NAD-dependent aldehyde dehydrogenase
MYVGGKFPRTESGRFYTAANANVCLASRKDLRNAVVAARAAQAPWQGRSAYNRSQILYRVAEMLQGRAAQFVEELVSQGLTVSAAKKEVLLSIDRLIYYAGWCDKYQQVFSTVNPVASSHFNFSVLEPMGVVFGFASADSPLLGLVSMIAPIVASGNTCVVLASQASPLSAVTFGEVLQTSDVPGGVVNLLTGVAEELVPHAATHMDINAIAADGLSEDQLAGLEAASASNLKRVARIAYDWFDSEQSQSPYLIEKFCELKTTWHPIEQISASGSGY